MKNKKIFKTVLILAVIFVMALCLTSCRKKGLSSAYEKFARDMEKAMKDADSSGAPLTNIQYNEELDRMYITLDEKADDPDKFFDALEKFIEDEDIGEIAIRQPYNEGEGHEEYMKKISGRLGKLSCKSLKMLIIEASPSDLGGAWTELLEKTDKLYLYNVFPTLMDDYAADEMARLAKVKSLSYYTESTGINFSIFSRFTGLEELILSAGLTESTWNERNGAGFGMYLNESDVSYIKSLPNLKRFLVYPEATGWKPGDYYYRFAYYLKRLIPKVETNIPGSSAVTEEPEEGEEEKEAPAVTQEIVRFRDYRILENADPAQKNNILKDELKKDAKRCFNKGKKFKKKKGAPKLYGKCLVYHGEPYSYQFGKNKFFDMTSEVLLNDLGIKKIQLPDDIYDYRMFIYIYPKHTYYGKYDKGTKGYSTKTMVAVYDMKKKIKYEAKQVKSENPPQSFSYYGTVPDRHYPDCSLKAAKKYIKGLKYKADKEEAQEI